MDVPFNVTVTPASGTPSGLLTCPLITWAKRGEAWTPDQKVITKQSKTNFLKTFFPASPVGDAVSLTASNLLIKLKFRMNKAESERKLATYLPECSSNFRGVND
jgi:hypothetical protein